MSLLDTLERKLRRFALPHLTLGLIVCQVVVFIASQVPSTPETTEPIAARVQLIPERVLHGEVWRLASFLIEPPTHSLIGALFFWYLFYLMGTALENYWGDFRYNVYLLIGYIATVALSFLTPKLPSSNTFLEASVFLAFAYLNPDFELYIFFILPVKIKWFALLTWSYYAVILLFGSWLSRFLVLASICNFLLFFGKDIIYRMRAGRRRMALQVGRFTAKEPAYFHRCTVCGITDRTDPRMDFRYCSKCAGTHGYCMEHLHSHQHITTPDQEPG